MKIAEPLKPTSPLSSGAGIVATSSADSQPAKSWTDGMMIKMIAKAELKS